MIVCQVRRREEVAEACLKPTAAARSTTTTTATTTTATRAAGRSMTSSHNKLVAAPAPSTSAWSAVPQSTSDGPTSSMSLSLFDMAGVSVGSFYCDYCNVFCNSESQLDAHCASAKHKLNISSDREHQWNFRPPPLTVTGGQYMLCLRSHHVYSLPLYLLRVLLRHLFCGKVMNGRLCTARWTSLVMG